MRQQRVRMDAFDRQSLLLYHQQAITHALAPQHSQKQMPCQLVFPDDTMAIGAPAVPNRALFPTDREAAGETEEDRQRRLLQNEPIVVYTSLSDTRVLRPEIFKRGLALLLVIAVQSVCIVVILTGGSGDQFYGADTHTPTTSQAGIYGAQLVLHPFVLLAIFLWNVEILKAYSVFVTLLFFLIMVLALRSFLDMTACALCVPIILLSNSIRELMMPHCFIVRR
eukprot:gnl/TRDRNA2_/TRDRNA2_172487_c0_seq4.p1 gnl/TRDRNA2_/TRDRNA2_172487_c0~~gnl/TRDRNA2_/TRDRNA2_172487_c0_seq4.p1  ORF type:complete len:224 (+),score=37.42 gnl/TRDRNA2_/TRDRNA2_172487_c0_seq4:79-750(+)